MHGVRRQKRPTAIEKKKELELAAVHADLIRRALELRKQPLSFPFNGDFSEKYKLVEKALETNPDEYTLWALRREVLLLKCEHLSSAEILGEWKEELALTMRGLQRNPKAYPAWQHRMWLLDDAKLATCILDDARLDAIRNEQKISAYILSKDGRNFHGWAHRMRVKSMLLSVVPERESDLDREELKFVENKIDDDFSNYSAWHHRSVLLPKIFDHRSNAFLSDELQYVRQAFYTDPSVQSAWFYYYWLLAGAPARGKKVVMREELCEEELRAFNELLALEPEAKYALQSRAHLLIRLGRHNEAKSVLDDLERIDPMRTGYYHYLRRKCIGKLGRNKEQNRPQHQS